MSDIQRWEPWQGAAILPDGNYVLYSDHVAALDAAVEDTRTRAYTLMGAAIQNGIDNERKRIRFAVGALPLDNSGRVDYADVLAAIKGDNDGSV